MRYKRVGCGLVVEREVRTEIIATPSHYVIIPNGKSTPRRRRRCEQRAHSPLRPSLAPRWSSSTAHAQYFAHIPPRTCQTPTVVFPFFPDQPCAQPASTHTRQVDPRARARAHSSARQTSVLLAGSPCGSKSVTTSSHTVTQDRATTLTHQVLSVMPYPLPRTRRLRMVRLATDLAFRIVRPPVGRHLSSSSRVCRLLLSLCFHRMRAQVQNGSPSAARSAVVSSPRASSTRKHSGSHSTSRLTSASHYITS